MKQLLIGLLVLSAFPALASNGSGTMGVVAITSPEAIDLRATPVIRFDGVVNDDVLISKVIDITLDGAGIFKQAKVPVMLLPEDWNQALEKSKASGGFEFVREAQSVNASK
ncbi:MAG: hypothetical protein EOP06_29675 [Proteobacteria bacterium]|nr:MAG: hypothetical protein EOP06_29675 [Pseudomonadota bacterium]